MAHPHEAPNHAHDEGKEHMPPQEKKKGFLDFEIAGFPWQFVVVLSLIAVAVLGMVLKVMGVF